MKSPPLPASWITQLAPSIAASVQEYHQQELHNIAVAAFHVGCYPWQGSLELSLLTVEELSADSLLLASDEVAAWQHYDFAAGLAAWERAVQLSRQMSDVYYAASESERPATVEAFLHACAVAVASPEVATALASLNRSADFKISVPHPDTNRQFYPPESTTHA